MNHFLITEVKKDKKTGLYGLVLIIAGFESRTQIDSVLEKDINNLKKHFRVDSLRLLSKIAFESVYYEPKAAFNNLLLNIEEKKNTSFEEIVLRKTAEALARFEKPDLNFADGKLRCSAFLKVFRGVRANPIWLTNFKAEVRRLSCGKVSLIDDDQDVLPYGIKGEHLILVRGQEKRKIIISPDSSPIEFVEV